MNLDIHSVTKIEIESVAGPFSKSLCRTIYITHDDGARTRLNLFGQDAADLALNLKRRVDPDAAFAVNLMSERLAMPVADSASAPDAAIAGGGL